MMNEPDIPVVRGLFSYPIPISNDCTARVMVPKDLKHEEAERICRVLRSLCVDLDASIEEHKKGVAV